VTTTDQVLQMKSKNPAAVALGKLGGHAKSNKKAAASRANGKRGGRPRCPSIEDREQALACLAEAETLLRRAYLHDCSSTQCAYCHALAHDAQIHRDAARRLLGLGLAPA
jgi:hypothetical protein